MNKKIILIAVLVISLIIITYQVFLKDKKNEFTLVEAVRGDIAQEIFESGQIEKSGKINLVFKNAGRIKEIYSQVGDNVEIGQELARLDASDIELQLQEARISLELAQLNLQKLLAGASPEEIKISQAQAENARIALGTAEENLKNSYETAMTVLDISQHQIYIAFDFLKEFVKDYVTIYDQDARKIMNAKEQISEAEKEARLYLEEAKKELSDDQKKEDALLTMRNSLEKTFNNLEIVRGIIDSSTIYRDSVSVSDKNSLNSLKTSVNSALSNVISVQQTISSMKLKVETTKTTLEEAENRLELVKSGPRQLDIDLYEAQIRQAENRVKLYENQVRQSKLFSPIQGEIVEVKKKVGELVQPTAQDVVMVILPAVPYQIKLDVYEEDVVKIAIGNSAEIDLIAFPKEKFKGKVVSISPAEKIIEGVVYYETIISFEEAPEGIKTGMTADVIIRSDLKKNVLLVPREAIQRKEDKNIVKIFKDGSEVEEKEIKTGIRGADNMVEVISGLEEGEKVISQ